MNTARSFKAELKLTLFVSTRTNLVYHRYVEEMAALRTVSSLTSVCVLSVSTDRVNESPKYLMSNLTEIKKKKKVFTVDRLTRADGSAPPAPRVAKQRNMETTLNQKSFKNMFAKFAFLISKNAHLVKS